MKRLYFGLLAVHVLFSPGDSGGGSGGNVTSADISRLNLNEASNLVVASADASLRSFSGRADNNSPNQLYTYNSEGDLEVVSFIDSDGESMEYTETFQPLEVLDFPSYLIINFHSDSFRPPSDKVVIIEKGSGNAFKLDAGSWYLQYNPNVSFRSIHETETGDLLAYLLYYNDESTPGFYKMSTDGTGMNASLIYGYESTCNNPDFLADKYGNFAYEDSCKPWKVFTGSGRLSTVASGEFSIPLLTSGGRLVNGDRLLSMDGMSSSVFTNNPFELWQTDIVQYHGTKTYIVTQHGVTVYDEADTDPNTNVTDYTPSSDWGFTSSADFNDLLVIDNKAYIGTETGLAVLYLDGSGTFESNVLDDIYKVRSLALVDEKIIFTGLGPFVDTVIAEYDPIADSTTVTQSFSQSVDIKFTKIN